MSLTWVQQVNLIFANLTGQWPANAARLDRYQDGFKVLGWPFKLNGDNFKVGHGGERPTA